LSVHERFIWLEEAAVALRVLGDKGAPFGVAFAILE
jgi:hypothetical protein